MPRGCKLQKERKRKSQPGDEHSGVAEQQKQAVRASSTVYGTAYSIAYSNAYSVAYSTCKESREGEREPAIKGHNSSGGPGRVRGSPQHECAVAPCASPLQLLNSEVVVSVHHVVAPQVAQVLHMHSPPQQQYVRVDLGHDGSRGANAPVSNALTCSNSTGHNSTTAWLTTSKHKVTVVHGTSWCHHGAADTAHTLQRQ